MIALTDQQLSIRHAGRSKPMQWQLIANAPFDRDLELAVIERDGLHALVFPCRRILNGWIRSGTQERIGVQPTHWRLWISAPSARSDP